MASLFTVNQEAKKEDCPYTPHRLRLMIAQGRCPGVRVGNRFMINHDLLLEQIRAESMAQVTQEVPQ